MAIFEILTAALAPTVGKILIKAYFGDTAADLGGSLVELAAQKFRDRAERRRVTRLVEELADQVISQLVPVFEAEKRRGVSVEAIAHELAVTMASAPALEVLLKGDLDSSKATRAYRKARSLPENQFSAAEIAFYERALQQTVHHLAAVAVSCRALTRRQPRKAYSACRRSRQIPSASARFLRNTGLSGSIGRNQSPRESSSTKTDTDPLWLAI